VKGIPARLLARGFAWCLCCLLPAYVDSQPTTREAPVQNYTNLAGFAMLKRAEEASRALSEGGFISEESFAKPKVYLKGDSPNPSGAVVLSACEYEFREGIVYAVHRNDLFENSGPDSVLLKHLTNEVLTLTETNAASRAFDLLSRLSYDANRIRATHRAFVTNELLGSYPIREVSRNVPKDLHVPGELISRKKIRIMVSISPFIRSSDGKIFETGHLEFLASTGELLDASLLPPLEISRAFNFAGPTLIKITDKNDASAFPLLNSHNRPTAVGLLGEEWVRFLQQADRVQAFRISEKPEPSRETRAGYPVVSGLTLGPDSARVLISGVLNDDFRSAAASRCLFKPEIIFEIWRDDQFARLIMCLGCSEALLSFHDKEERVLYQPAYRFHVGGRFIALEIAQKTLPGDAELEDF